MITSTQSKSNNDNLLLGLGQGEVNSDFFWKFEILTYFGRFIDKTVIYSDFTWRYELY